VNRGLRISFIVRVVFDSQGNVSGVIERVSTGAKEAFHGVEAIGAVIARMLQSDRTGTRTVPDTPPDVHKKSISGRRRPKPS
jgi:hypothetical protein